MITKAALVIVTSSFPISGDGSEAAGAFVADLAEELAKHLPVRVVAPGRADAREMWTQDVEVFRYAAPDQALSTLKLWHPVDAMRVLHVLHAGQRATERAVTAGPTAHVLALWALPCGQWARHSAHRHDLSYSVWTLGSDIWSLGRIPLIRSLLRRVLRDAKHCWSDGLKLRDETKSIAGRSVSFLPSTRRIEKVRTEALRSEPPYRLLFLGRWHPNKGIDLLLDALTLLPNSDWALIERVTIAGGGPLKSIVEAGVRHLQASGRPVEPLGYLKRVEAQQAMLDADYLLIPSRIESIPVVFSDAMKLDLPVISMPVGDLLELVSSGVGILSKRVDAHSFAQAIQNALQAARNPVELRRMSACFDLGSAVEEIICTTSSVG